jgi:hypothetical protein
MVLIEIQKQAKIKDNGKNVALSIEEEHGCYLWVIVV